MGHFPGLIPKFGHLLGVARQKGTTSFNFGLRMTQLTPDFNFPKVSMVVEDYWVLARIDGETADFPKTKRPKYY